MNTVGSSYRLDTMLYFIQQTQKNMQSLEYQIATGKKGPTFTDYTETVRMVNFNASIEQREQFITNTDRVTTRLRLVDQALDQIGDIADEAARFPDLAEYDPDQATELRETAQGWLQTVISTLNTHDGESYLFGGLVGDRKPVEYSTAINDPSLTNIDWASFDAGTAPSAPNDGYFWFLNKDILQAGSPTNPQNNPATELPANFAYLSDDLAGSTPYATYRSTYYQGGAGVSQSGDVDAGLKIRIDSDQTASVGFSAAEPGFEKLMFGLQMMVLIEPPDENPGPGEPTFEEQRAFYTANIEAAQKLIEDAIPEIKATHIRAASTQITVENTLERLQQVQTLEQNLLGELETADAAEAIVSLQLLQTSLEATYQVTAQVNRLTLTNFI